MKRIKELMLVLLCGSLFLTACDKDDDDNNGGNNSRTVKYEFSGDFKGTVFASYTTASGGTANDQVSLPWTKEITYASNVTAAIIAAAGNGGTPGQKVTINIKKGNSQLTPIEATANSAGSFSVSAPAIVF